MKLYYAVESREDWIKSDYCILTYSIFSVNLHDIMGIECSSELEEFVFNYKSGEKIVAGTSKLYTSIRELKKDYTDCTKDGIHYKYNFYRCE